jgi:hypothetical protein
LIFIFEWKWKKKKGGEHKLQPTEQRTNFSTIDYLPEKRETNCESEDFRSADLGVVVGDVEVGVEATDDDGDVLTGGAAGCGDVAALHAIFVALLADVVYAVVCIEDSQDLCLECSWHFDCNDFEANFHSFAVDIFALHMSMSSSKFCDLAAADDLHTSSLQLSMICCALWRSVSPTRTASSIAFAVRIRLTWTSTRSDEVPRGDPFFVRAMERMFCDPFCVVERITSKYFTSTEKTGKFGVS